MQNATRQLFLAAAVVSVAGITTNAFGQARTWDGGTDADNLWSTADNWDTDTAPPTTPQAGEGWRLGSSSTELVTDMDMSYTFGQLQFIGEHGYTINSSNGSTLNLAGFNNGQVINMTGVNTATINAQLAIVTGNTTNIPGEANRRTINPGSDGTVILNNTLTVDPQFDLRKLGGVLVLDVPNVIPNTFEINNGDVRIGTDTSLGAATISNPTGNTIRILSNNATARTLANDFAFSGQGAVVFTEDGGPDATVNGNITLGTISTGITTVGGGTGTTVTFNGVLSGDGGIAKTTEATYVFNNDNTYLGNTFVGNGTLVLNGNSVSDTLVGGGKLQGTGSVRILSVFDDLDNTNPAGILSPGDDVGVGTFTASRADFADGGTYLFNLNDVGTGAGTGWDLLSLDGSDGTADANLDITATAGSFTIDIDGSGAGFDESQSYAFVMVDGADVTGFDASAFTLDTSGFSPSFSGDFGLGVVGGDLVLSYTPVPEPTSAALFGLMGLGLLRGRRRA